MNRYDIQYRKILSLLCLPVPPISYTITLSALNICGEPVNREYTLYINRSRYSVFSTIELNLSRLKPRDSYELPTSVRIFRRLSPSSRRFLILICVLVIDTRAIHPTTKVAGVLALIHKFFRHSSALPESVRVSRINKKWSKFFTREN